MITNGRYIAENDDTPDKETKMYYVQTFTCRNPQCDDYKKEIGEVKNPIELG